MNLVTLLVFSVTLIDQSSCLCDDYNATDTRANQCYELIRSMEDSLLQDKGNILRLQNAFFYSPTANPVLLKVDYIVTFNEVFTMWTSGESPGINASSESMYCNQPDPHNTTIIDLNETLISRGWTSSGVYTLFHPGVLNLMQLQLPYILLNLIQSSTVQSTDGPEADSFLWDGSFELPTLRLNLHISHLNCLPSQDLFNAVLDKITSQV